MMVPFRKTMFNCKQATLLSIKKEEGKITPVERLKLWYHLLYCDPCRRFIYQWSVLTKKKFTLISMSDQAKKRIQQKIDEMP
jgi:hypothetical protein